MLKAILDFYKKYAVFQGRTGLKDYRSVSTYNAVVVLLLILTGPTILQGFIFTSFDSFILFLGLPGSWILFHFIPLLALQVRRMHDLGKSGASLLIPGGGIQMFWQKGQPVENQYGPVPTD